MGAETVGQAVASMKKAQGEMVQWENMLESIKAKVTDLSRQRDEVHKQIDLKVSNANIVMSEQRSKLDAERQFVQSEREKLEQGKKEISAQIDVFRTEKAAFTAEKEAAQRLLAAAKQSRSNVDQFIIAVKRAYDVLG